MTTRPISHTWRPSSRFARLAALTAAATLLACFHPARGDDSLTLLQAPEAENAAPTVEAASAASQVVTFKDGWTMTITPQASRSITVNGRSYKAIYESIPYRQSEYLANPSYRHDTTVELLFGAMRPTVINRTDTPERIVNQKPDLQQFILSNGAWWGYSPSFRYFLPYMP